jgi:hypothetical protein
MVVLNFDMVVESLQQTDSEEVGEDVCGVNGSPYTN